MSIIKGKSKRRQHQIRLMCIYYIIIKLNSRNLHAFTSSSRIPRWHFCVCVDQFLSSIKLQFDAFVLVILFKYNCWLEASNYLHKIYIIMCVWGVCGRPLGHMFEHVSVVYIWLIIRLKPNGIACEKKHNNQIPTLLWIDNNLLRHFAYHLLGSVAPYTDSVFGITFLHLFILLYLYTKSTLFRLVFCPFKCIHATRTSRM